jgi:predicted HAD superfamily Cof-like phosphohydrolase
MSPFDDVLEFHRAFFPDGVSPRPLIPEPRVQQLWQNLVQEEMEETLHALRSGNLVGIADGIADSIYVLCGTAIQYGIPLPAIWSVVHQANMRKIGGASREDGKVLKPDGWVAPDVEAVLAKYREDEAK